MSHQTNLFTPAIEHKEKALAALARLSLREAREQLRIAKEIDAGLANLDTLIRAVDFLHDMGLSPRTRVPGLAKAWQRLGEVREDLSDAVHSELQTRLCRRLVELLPSGYNDYVEPGAKTLHIGYCHLVLNQPEEAHKKLLDYLTARREESHARLWGYFGDAAYELRHREESNAGYACALFMDPQALDTTTLKEPQLGTIYHELRQQHDDDLARALLPSEAWLQGALQVPKGNTFLALFIQRQRFDHSAELLLYPKQRYHQFALCLYIDQSGMHGDIDFDAREEMQRLDGELFRRYLDVLALQPAPERIVERW